MKNAGGNEDDDGSDGEEGDETAELKQDQVVAVMVSEIVLCCKEVNQKTREAAYLLLVRLAHSMHDAEPPQLMMEFDDPMGE